jgi:tripartite-type tricarboxylate transporter receptor subunit TctC
MTRIHRRLFNRHGIALAGLALLSTGLLQAPLAQAQPAWPTSKPITIVVPHAAGGAVDGVARTLADRLTAELKQSVVVDNRPGASGLIGTATVARAEPDGYTLYFNASIHAAAPLLYKSQVKFDPIKDFTPIGMVAEGALIFSVNPQVPANTVQELVNVAKANPSKYSFTTSGFGSAGHLGIAQFMAETGLAEKNIPIVLYKGAAPALQDLIGGQVHAMMDPFLSSLPHVKSGKLRAIAQSGRTRSPLLPDVPTLKEAGLKDFEFYSWYGLWAPAKLPPAVLKALEGATEQAVKSEPFKAKLNGLGFEATFRNSADFNKYIISETAKYQAIINKAGIQIE